MSASERAQAAKPGPASVPSAQPRAASGPVTRLGGDLRILLHLLRGQPKSGDQRTRLQAFYGPQAGHYDVFRDRLLHGRERLIDDLHAALLHERQDALGDAHVIELGGGTGRNLEFFGSRLDVFGQVTLVDLCPALLERARRKFSDRPQVSIIEADATRWQPEQPADAVYCAYSLSMIPDWRATIDNALAMLKPGGIFAVVDFYVSAAKPPDGQIRHGALTRWFWPRWFAHDGVHPSPEHLAALRARFPAHQFSEERAPVPYLPGFSVPYYRFLGRLG